jgi:hypothetical protein
MKKILMSLSLTLLFVGAKAQDSIQLSTVTVQNTTLTTDYFPFFRFSTDTQMYRIPASRLMPWVYDGTTTLYPRSTSYNLVLGATSNIAAYKFYNAGTSYLAGDMTMSYGKKILFNYSGDVSCYLYRLGDDIIFHDPNAGTVKLSDMKGGGGGVVDTAGGQTTNQVAYWTDSHTLDGDAGLAYNAVTNLLTAGGVATSTLIDPNSVYHIAMNSTAWSFTNNTDTTLMLNGTGVYLRKSANFTRDTVALILYTIDGMIATAEIVDAGFGLKKVPLFLKYFFNRISGELNWSRKAGDSYHQMNAATSTVQLQAGIERAYVWIFRMQIFIFFLVVVIIWLVYQVLKLKRNA